MLPLPHLTEDIRIDGIKLLQSSDTYVQTLLQRFNSEYRSWDKIKRTKLPDHVTPESVWAALKLIRNSSSSKINLHGIAFQYLIGEALQRDLHFLDLECGGNLSSSRSLIPAKETDRFLVSSLIEEAFSSSALEGAVTTRDVAKSMIRSGKKPKDKSEQMVLNNYHAMEFIKENSSESLTEPLLLELHNILTKGTLENEECAGRYRNKDEDVRVIDAITNETVHFPPSATEVPAMMIWLISFFNQNHETESNASKNPSFVHPIVQASIVHFMIGFIHPFVDGNGRLARALTYWLMLSQGYWLTQYMSISSVILRSRPQYYNAFLLTEKDSNDLTYFIHYQVRTLQKAYERLKEYLHSRARVIKTRIVDEAQEKGITHRQAELLMKMQEEVRTWTAREVQTLFQVSSQTARNDLAALTARKFIRKVQINNHSQAWILNTTRSV